MFTGIVEEIGIVKLLAEKDDIKLWDGSTGPGIALQISCQTVLEDAYIGCSIAINGTCLTVVSFDSESGEFEVHLAPETLRRTNLGQLREGDGVNLERAMKASDRNSGHVVQGHIDGTGTVHDRRPDGDSLWMYIKTTPELMKYIVEKGFIAVDGTSLTVCDVDQDQCIFSFMLVPHTQASVVLPQRKVGHHVNLEVDVTAKYVDNMMQGYVKRIETLEKKLGGSSVSDAASSSSQPQSNEEMKVINKTLKHKHGSNLQVPLPCKELASNMRIAIVRTCWHDHLIAEMVRKCKDTLTEKGVTEKNIVETVVPGSFELPYATKLLAQRGQFDAIVTIGILLKGGTIHMEVIAQGVTAQLQQLQMDYDVPIVFGLLTVLSMDQAEERAYSPLGHSWGEAALCMAYHKHRKGFVTM